MSSHRPPKGSRLQQAWLHRGLLAWLLWPISLLMRLIVALRRQAFAWGLLRSEHPGVPVIVVGNVVAGGAGKTPTVIAVVRHLQACGLHPGVISRGYGRVGDDCREVTPDSTPEQSGDEPLLVRRSTAAPVFVAPQRMEAAQALRQTYPETDVIVCDDGLQHLALRRDLEICVFDERGVGKKEDEVLTQVERKRERGAEPRRALAVEGRAQRVADEKRHREAHRQEHARQR